MNATINLIVLAGRIASNPVFAQTGAGAPVCNFTLETVDEWTDRNGEPHSRTDRHRVAVFGRNDAQHPHQRGDYVVVRGRLRYQDSSGLPEIVAAACASPWAVS